MAIDAELLWNALGTFFERFPPEERTRVTSFWENFGEKSADLLGRAVQLRDSDSVFRTKAFVERRYIVSQFSQLQQDPFTEFRLVSVDSSNTDFSIFKGHLPVARRVNVEDIPDEGQLRIGADVLDYIEANLEVITSGVREGLVTEATFTVPNPPRDYSDSIDPNETFPIISTSLTLRRDHLLGEGVIDTTGPVGLTLNKRGRLQLDGVDYEYESVSITGDRYLFTLATTYSAPEVTGQTVLNNISLGEAVTVFSYDDERWDDNSFGSLRVATSPLSIFVDEGPAVIPTRGEISSSFELEQAQDVDINATISLPDWPDPTVNNTERVAALGVRIGSGRFLVGAYANRDGVGTTTYGIIFGQEGTLSRIELGELPSELQVRIQRTGSTLEFSYRLASGDPWNPTGFSTSTTERMRISFLVTDDGTGVGSESVFDELERFLGEVSGGTRLEETFLVTSRFPNRYVLDIDLAATEEMLDRPSIREEDLTVTSNLTDEDLLEIELTIGEAERKGIPLSGTLVIGGYERIYDEATFNNGTVTLLLRRKLPPDLFPITSGTAVSVKTRRLTAADAEYEFEEPGVIRLRELPTRDRMWSPIAQVDERWLQRRWAPLVRTGQNRESSLYLERLIQGHWSSLMGGPTIFNLQSGVALAMGLPVAAAEGVVTSIVEARDALGRIVERRLDITNDEGVFQHFLPAESSLLIDWTTPVGTSVIKFQPLTNGVEILDLDNDPTWVDRFGYVNDAERFRSFGVILDMSALGPDTDIGETLSFALRAKPNDSKLFIGLFSNALGDEDLSDELDDEAAIAQLVLPCEEVAFDEGPLPPGQPLTLGAGYKLGMGYILGPNNQQKYLTLGSGLFLGQGLTLGQSLIYYCEPVAANLPEIEESVTQVIGVQVSP